MTIACAANDQLIVASVFSECAVIDVKKNLYYVLNLNSIYKLRRIYLCNLDDTCTEWAKEEEVKKNYIHTYNALSDIALISSSSRTNLKCTYTFFKPLNRFREKGKIKTVNIYFDMTFCYWAIYMVVCLFVCFLSLHATLSPGSHMSLFSSCLHKTTANTCCHYCCCCCCCCPILCSCGVSFLAVSLHFSAFSARIRVYNNNNLHHHLHIANKCFYGDFRANYSISV